MGVGSGVLAHSVLQRRIAVLAQFEILIRRISEHICGTAAPIGTILRTLSQTTEFASFVPLTRTVKNMGDEGEFRVSWQQAAEVCGREWSLSEQEQQLLVTFGFGLGEGDIAREQRRCEQYAERVKECLVKRRAEAAIRGRLYTALGFCGGSAAVLLLL